MTRNYPLTHSLATTPDVVSVEGWKLQTRRSTKQNATGLWKSAWRMWNISKNMCARKGKTIFIRVSHRRRHSLNRISWEPKTNLSLNQKNTKMLNISRRVQRFISGIAKITKILPQTVTIFSPTKAFREIFRFSRIVDTNYTVCIWSKCDFTKHYQTPSQADAGKISLSR